MRGDRTRPGRDRHTVGVWRCAGEQSHLSPSHGKYTNRPRTVAMTTVLRGTASIEAVGATLRCTNMLQHRVSPHEDGAILTDIMYLIGV